MRKNGKQRAALVVIMAVCLLMTAACSSGNASNPPASSGQPPAAVTPDGTVEFEPMVIKIGNPNPATDIELTNYASYRLSEYVAEATGGAVDIQVFGGGQIGYEPDLIEGFKLGTTDMAIITNAVISSRLPVAVFIELPFMFSGYEEVHNYLDIDGAFREAVRTQSREIIGAEFLGYSLTGYNQLWNNIRPFNSVADLKSVKMRTTDAPIRMRQFSLMGANPTPVTWSECFTALQQGTVEGMEGPFSTQYTTQMYTLLKYCDMTYHIYNSNGFLVDNELWASMSPELRQIIQDGCDYAIQEARAYNFELEENKFIPDMEAAGVTFNFDPDTSGMKEAVQPMYEDCRNTIGAELFDAFMADLEKLR
ncbi:MAG: TRAP transporter substrate-binding protein [Gracilibacteraceae bacterium]|nr:TRAP transporter substrate-binding protein [Gracilibacteraceae bacterium]